MSTTLADVSEEAIPSLPVGELKRLLSYHNVSYEGIFEKQDLVNLAINTKRAIPPPSPAIVPYVGHKTIKDMDLYALLEVPKTATLAEITKSYYRLARELHPDKNPNNPFAEEKFKLISEAYQLLSNPDKRRLYDEHGMQGVQEDFIDPKEIFRMIFGGGKFENIFGDLLFFDLDPSAMGGEEGKNNAAGDMSQLYGERQEEKAKILAKHLVIKLEPFVQGLKQEFTKLVEAEAMELAEVPGGQELLQLVGYVYIQEAKQHLDKFLGIPAFFSRVAEKGHMFKLMMDTMSHMIKMQAAMKHLENMQKNSDAPPPDSMHMMVLMQEGLKTIWAMGKVEIDMTLRLVCETVLREDKRLRKERAKGLKLMGEIYEKVAKSNHLMLGSSPFQQGPFAAAFQPPPS